MFRKYILQDNSLTFSLLSLQKQLPEVFYKKRCSWKFCNIHKKTAVLKSPFNSSWSRLQACNFLKKRLQHRCFPVNIVKFLRTSTLNICERLLLSRSLFGDIHLWRPQKRPILWPFLPIPHHLQKNWIIDLLLKKYNPQTIHKIQDLPPLPPLRVDVINVWSFYESLPI